jgi:undecaprenyl-diphosphatase
MYDKRFAYKYGLVYFSSCIFNMGFKKLVRRPRPIGATASGYSFPSGHSQSYSTVVTGLIYEANKKKFPEKRWQRIEFLTECIVVGLLVGIGRMYWGQHYLTDVLAGLILGVVFTVVATYLIDVIISRSKMSLDKFFLIMAPILIVAYIVIVSTNLFNDVDTLAKVYRAIGLTLSVIVGYFADKKWIKYSTEDTMKNKMSKMIAGSATLMMIYSFVLRDLAVNAVYPIYYFVVGLIATIALPWIFKTIKNPAESSKE